MKKLYKVTLSVALAICKACVTMRRILCVVILAVATMSENLRAVNIGKQGGRLDDPAVPLASRHRETLEIPKQSVKQLILRGIECAGLNRLARHRTRGRLLGLCYHGVLSAECPKNDARLALAVINATELSRFTPSIAR